MYRVHKGYVKFDVKGVVKVVVNIVEKIVFKVVFKIFFKIVFKIVVKSQGMFRLCAVLFRVWSGYVQCMFRVTLGSMLEILSVQ